MINLLPAKHLPKDLIRDRERGRTSKLYPDLNISKASRAIQCGQSHLSNILHGKKNGALPLLEMIAVTLGITLDELSKLRKRAIEAEAGMPKNSRRKSSRAA